MSIVPFEPPEWLKNTSARGIQERMMRNLPLDIDKTEGGFAWDLTMPTALEKAELLQVFVQRTLQMMHPMWAEGYWLDCHAVDIGIERRAANKAYGHLTIKGKPGRLITKGFVFSVPSVDGAPAIDFETLEDSIIPDSGELTVAIQALLGGQIGNVPNDTVTIMRSPISGIYSITNKEAITGGAEQESDASLRQRIDDINAGRGKSYTGNNADYVRWASEVPGVGLAHTIPGYKGENSVKLVIVDTNGMPANQQILSAVFRHIWGSDDLADRKSMARIAPIGMIHFEVAAPQPIIINYKVRLRLVPGTDIDMVKSRYKAALMSYYMSVVKSPGDAKSIRYNKTYAILADEVPGVADFDEFYMNGAESNVSFQSEEYPVTGEIEVELYA